MEEHKRIFNKKILYKKKLVRGRKENRKERKEEEELEEQEQEGKEEKKENWKMKLRKEV